MPYISTSEILDRMTLEQLQDLFKGYEELVKAYSQITKLRGRKAYLGAFQIMSNFARQNYQLLDKNY